MSDKLRKALFFVVILLCAAGIFGAGMAFGAGSGEPGSQGDPIVTLSYLESRLGSGTSGNAGTGAGFQKHTLSKGQNLKLSDGGMMIVFSGNGKIGGETGMLNLSTGEIFGDGTSAVLYSVFMGIGDDSRVTAAGNMVVYVAGSCEIN